MNPSLTHFAEFFLTPTGAGLGVLFILTATLCLARVRGYWPKKRPVITACKDDRQARELRVAAIAMHDYYRPRTFSGPATKGKRLAFTNDRHVSSRIC